MSPLFAGAPCVGGTVAEDLFRRGICLPSSSSLPLADQERIIGLVRGVARTRAPSRIEENGRAPLIWAIRVKPDGGPGAAENPAADH